MENDNMAILSIFRQVIKKLKTLYFIQLFKIKKGKCLFFFFSIGAEILLLCNLIGASSTIGNHFFILYEPCQ